MPHVWALVYGRNTKGGCFCGFFKDIPKFSKLKVADFLKRYALAGPGSKVRCILQPEGPFGYIEHCGYEKEHALCQVPGYRYTGDFLAPIPMPMEWTSHVLSEEVVRSITLKKLPGA